jgi:hypothetical protein
MEFNPDQFLQEANAINMAKAPQGRAPQNQAPFDPDKFLADINQLPPVTDEADLGLTTRFKYSLEPLESNRRALLIEQFGAENVKEDEKGDLFVMQNGQFHPVNAPGISFTDVANIAGALPEGLGTTAGAMAGMGVGSVPAAAGGAALGSAIRQGLSAAVGTPQVAPPSERAGEVLLSGVMGAGGAMIGKGIKTAAKKIFPRFRVDEKIKNIAKELDLPEPTTGQLAKGRDLEIEKQLAETPFFGRKIRRINDKQITKIKQNLRDQFGDFGEVDMDRAGVGSTLKERAGKTVSAIKNQSQGLYDEITAGAKEVAVPSNEFKRSLAGQFNKLGLVDEAGNKLKHSAKTGLTKTQFERLQGIASDVLEQIDNSAGEIPGTKNMGIDASDINVIRKYVDANIREGQKAQLDDVALIKLRESLMEVTEDMLSEVDPKLQSQFREARGLWKKYLENKKIFETGKGLNLKNMSDEKVLQRVFRDKDSVESFKQLVDDESAKEAGDSFIRDILSKRIGGEEQISARGAISAIRAKREAIREAIGKDAYNTMMKNLEFLDMVGKPINPSKTAITDLRTNILKGTGLSLQRAGRTKLRGAVENLPITGLKLSNIAGDPFQRESAFDHFAGPKVPYKK